MGVLYPINPPKTPQGHVQSYQTYSGQTNAQRMIKTKLLNFLNHFCCCVTSIFLDVSHSVGNVGPFVGGKCCFFPTAVFPWDRVFESSLAVIPTVPSTSHQTAELQANIHAVSAYDTQATGHALHESKNGHHYYLLTNGFFSWLHSLGPTGRGTQH